MQHEIAPRATTNVYRCTPQEADALIKFLFSQWAWSEAASCLVGGKLGWRIECGFSPDKLPPKLRKGIRD